MSGWFDSTVVTPALPTRARSQAQGFADAR